MRIIAGKHRSRILKTLEGANTRPMMDVMKESVFNSIGPYFDGGLVLDLFGGSGALSLESISRGASHAYISELNKDAYKVILSNVCALKEEENVTVMNMDYKLALKRLVGTKFDYIFLDPPYRLNIISDIVKELEEYEMIKEGTIIICHYVTGNQEILPNYFLKKHYAKANHELAIYMKK